ncbi:MAG: alkaline phosphatase D family protein [Pseudomonadota bacterium]
MQRRHFLKSVALGLGTLPLAQCTVAPINLRTNPFQLGIASGDATDDAIVLWTRLAPSPDLADGGMPEAPVAVRWTIATDAELQNVIRRGDVAATPEWAHSVHIDVQALAPDQTYFYQFESSGFVSQVGQTRTLPRTETALSRARFVTASCQNYTHGLFRAYRQMVKDAPQFVIHLGDYIYDVAYGEDFRSHETLDQPATLDAFRRRHALYKTDKDLQLAHQQLPFYAVLDNHDAIEWDDTNAYPKRAAAYQAWYEHMPVRGYAAPGANTFDMHRRIPLGDLATLHLLDPRQFRDERTPCEGPVDRSYGFGNYRERCASIFDDKRTMLGEGQERWLTDGLMATRSPWNVLTSPGPFLPYRFLKDGEDRRYIGAWDGYPAQRQRVAAALLGNTTSHPLILSGDVHSFWAMDGGQYPLENERFGVTEFVASSISANWPPPLADIVTENRQNNPHLAFYGPAHRGYLLHDVTEETWTTKARAVSDAKDPNATVDTLASFTVVNGEPGFVIAEPGG